MDEWIFTFGVGHKHAGHYVRIKGTYEDARAEMMRRYGRAWAWQYSIKEWERMENDPERCIYLETELKEDDSDEKFVVPDCAEVYEDRESMDAVVIKVPRVWYERHVAR